MGALALYGCTTGPLEVEELYYLRVTNGQDNAYFRIKVTGNTTLSDTQFRQGWFPASAVDSLFGDISDGNVGELITRETLRKQIDEAVIETNRQYLGMAINPDTDSESLNKYLVARNRVFFAPEASLGNLEQTTIMEYNPGADLIVRRDGQKLIFFLSADPDQIIGQISQFAEDEKTQAEIQKLTNMMVNSSRAKVIRKKAVAEVERKMDALIKTQLETTLQQLPSGTKRDDALESLDILINLLRSSLEQGRNEP